MPTETLQAGVAVLALVAMLLAVVVLIAALRVVRRATGTPGPAGADRPPFDPRLDQALASSFQRLDAIGAELGSLGNRTATLEAHARGAIQHVGLVRFNPFEDTGGNQSFALALLDSDANGIVLSSLHSRQATRLYLKSIQAGRCESALSTEETAALRQAGLAV